MPKLHVARPRPVVRDAVTSVAARLLLGRSNDLGRDERFNAALFSGVLMHLLAVVAGVGQERRDRLAA